MHSRTHSHSHTFSSRTLKIKKGYYHRKSQSHLHLDNVQLTGSTSAKACQCTKLLIIHQMYHFQLVLWYHWLTTTAAPVKSHLGSDVWKALTHPFCSVVMMFRDLNQRHFWMKTTPKAINLSIPSCFTFVSVPRWVSDLLIVHVTCKWPCFALSYQRPLHRDE